jgi:hypothetical protein
MLHKDFLEAWEAYGKVGNRFTAHRAWEKLKPDRATLLAGISRYQATKEWKDGYRKHMATWLNARGWEDEYEPPPNGRSPARPRDFSASELPAGWVPR